jgi:hypothetical protein
MMNGTTISILTTVSRGMAPSTSLFVFSLSLKVLNDPDMDLRTIKHLIFKGSGDFILYYRLKNA